MSDNYDLAEPQTAAVPTSFLSLELKDTSMRRYYQYTTPDGKVFLPAAKTQAKLPSGMYQISHSEQGIIISLEEFLTDSLMVLPDSKSEFILKEIAKFWTLKEKYLKYGLIHKRGFLLHGPPGGGKTSTVALVTKHMIQEDGIVLVCQNIKLLEMAIKSIREVENTRKITVLLEDVDELLLMGQEHHLLNLLDGASQVDNVVYIATTNYPEKLPDRLINRPSRFDYIVEIAAPNAESRTIYLNNKVGSYLVKQNDKEYNLVELTEDFTFAHLRDLVASIYCLDLPVEDTIDRLRKMRYEKPSSDRYNALKGIGI